MLRQFESLKHIIQSFHTTVVAFSGGVDSALVLKVARDVLGRSHVRAVTADSPSVPRQELEDAVQLAKQLDVEHHVVQTRELENQNYRSNSKQRCYFCKTELYDQLAAIKDQWNFETIANGCNLDDLNDFRPGLLAADEHHVKSPLVLAQFSKSDVRELSRQLGLSVFDKPASPCLSSRIPYGSEVNEGKLSQVEAGEQFLKEHGFRVVRLRHFGDQARIELGKDEFLRVMDVALRNEITEHILSLGFKLVRFEPYQSGNLNEEVSVKPSQR